MYLADMNKKDLERYYIGLLDLAKRDDGVYRREEIEKINKDLEVLRQRKVDEYKDIEEETIKEEIHQARNVITRLELVRKSFEKEREDYIKKYGEEETERLEQKVSLMLRTANIRYVFLETTFVDRYPLMTRKDWKDFSGGIL